MVFDVYAHRGKRYSAQNTIVKLAGDDSGTRDDGILGASRRLKRQTWKHVKYRKCNLNACACSMKIMLKENLRKRAEKFRQWKEDECLRVPNEACFGARTGTLLKLRVGMI